MGLPLHGCAGGNRLLHRLRNRQYRQHRRSSPNPVAKFHLDCRVRIDQNIHARAKLDQSHTLAPGYAVSNLEIENDAARDQTGDLLEYYDTPSPSTVTMFCSFSSAEFPPMALRNLPR